MGTILARQACASQGAYPVEGETVEHSFRVIKGQLGYTKVKYRGNAKNTAKLMQLFTLSNLRMGRVSLLH